MTWYSSPFSPSEVEKREWETYKEAFGRVLNNFYCHFPIGTVPYSSRNPLGIYRSLIAKRTHRAHKDGMLEQERCNFSEKYANQTPCELWETFDTCVKEIGIPMNTLSEAINRAFGSCKEEHFKTLWELMIPIYTELRKRGYSPRDITG